MLDDCGKTWKRRSQCFGQAVNGANDVSPSPSVRSLEFSTIIHVLDQMFLKLKVHLSNNIRGAQGSVAVDRERDCRPMCKQPLGVNLVESLQ